MATTPTFNSPPQPAAQGTGAPPQAQSPQGSGLQGPASPIMQLLSNWHRVSGEIGQVHPQIASMMQKVASETQQALMILAKEQTQGQQQGGLPTQPESQPTGQATVPPHNYPPSGY